jgi:methionine sulfoxide reductase heme-binding subunit
MRTKRLLPWLDRSGRLSALKLVVFISLFIPGLLVSSAYFAGALGARPLTEVLHQAGLWTIRFLFIALAITPLREILDWPRLVTVRRMLGVAAFAYGMSHLLLYATDEKFDFGKVALEIILRFYLTIGFVALLSLSVLAATSTDAMIRRLGGKRWRNLHRIVYGIGVLALVHYFIQSKANVSEPFFMIGLYVWLMSYRAVAAARREKGAFPLLALVLLALGATAATALGEAVYFWLKLGVDPMRVLAANWTFVAGPRPGFFVLLAALAVILAAVLRRAAARFWPARRPSGAKLASAGASPAARAS